MNKEFKKIAGKKETRYVLESASAGATSAASVATGPTGKKGNLLVQGKDDKPVVQRRNPVAAKVNAAVGGGGAGAHKDKTKTIPRKEKHKKDWRKEFEEGVAEGDYGIPDIPRFVSFYNKKGQLVGTSDHNGFHFTDEYYQRLRQDFERAQIDQMASDYNVAQKLKSGSWTAKKDMAEGSYKFNRKLGRMDRDSSDPDQRHGLFLNGKLVKTYGSREEAENVQQRDPKFKSAEIKKIVPEGWGMGGYTTYAGTRHGRGVAELDSHYIDQENDMTSSDLKSLYKQAVKLRNLIQKMGSSTTLEPWQQAKIAKAADYVNAVFKNLDNEYGLDKVEEKIKGADGKACWKGYRYAGTKNGKDRCVKVGEDNLQEYETHTYTDSQGRKWRVDDEGNKDLIYDPNDRFGSKSRYSAPKKLEVYYFYNVPDGSAMKAFDLGLKRTKSGKWYARVPIDAATAEFGNPKKWMPKAEESMMPASHFAGTPKNKLGPAAHLKGKMKRPAQQGDLVGGSAEESYSKKKT